MSINQLVMVGVAGLIVCGGAVIHGKKTDRWGSERSAMLAKYTQRLATVPTEFGPWTSKELEVDKEQFEESNCDGVYSRAFINSSTEESISVFLVSGKGYHCTIHTPDECYVAAGFEMGKDPIGYTFKAPGIEQECEFVHTIFDKETPSETERLRIFWLYSVDGKTWKSPKFAKYSYGKVDAMYKLYIIRSVANGVPKVGEDPSLQFAKQFLPILHQTLGADSAPATDSPSQPASAETNPTS